MKHLKPLDFIAILSSFFLGVYLICTNSINRAQKIIVIANNITYEYDANKNGTYTVNGLCGETTFEIQNGRVRIIDSACPNKTCVAQNWSSPLVCLPNKVIITAEQNNGEFDAFSE